MKTSKESWNQGWHLPVWKPKMACKIHPSLAKPRNLQPCSSKFHILIIQPFNFWVRPFMSFNSWSCTNWSWTSGLFYFGPPSFDFFNFDPSNFQSVRDSNFIHLDPKKLMKLFDWTSKVSSQVLELPNNHAFTSFGPN